MPCLHRNESNTEELKFNRPVVANDEITEVVYESKIEELKSVEEVNW
jgi:hypothetical protein